MCARQFQVERWFSHSADKTRALSFGDIHYFYGPPTENPPHHRFDKGSYVYLFENANERRARVEVANRPGTEEQDAFDGCENSSLLQSSCKAELQSISPCEESH